MEDATARIRAESTVIALITATLTNTSIAATRHEIGELVQIGRERRRGAGTFIAQSSDSSSSIWHFRFRAPHNGGGLLPWTSNVFDVQEIDEAGEWADFLGFAPGYIRIKRKINFEDFTVYSEMYLDGPRFAPILDVPKELLSQKNIRVFLHDRYNAPTFRAHHRVTSIQLDEQSAKIVGAAAGQLRLD